VHASALEPDAARARARIDGRVELKVDEEAQPMLLDGPARLRGRCWARGLHVREVELLLLLLLVLVLLFLLVLVLVLVVLVLVVLVLVVLVCCIGGRQVLALVHTLGDQAPEGAEHRAQRAARRPRVGGGEQARDASLPGCPHG
jgi:Flp pilus assembly protein TadB